MSNVLISKTYLLKQGKERQPNEEPEPYNNAPQMG